MSNYFVIKVPQDLAQRNDFITHWGIIGKYLIKYTF